AKSALNATRAVLTASAIAIAIWATIGSPPSANAPKDKRTSCFYSKKRLLHCSLRKCSRQIEREAEPRPARRPRPPSEQRMLKRNVRYEDKQSPSLPPET